MLMSTKFVPIYKAIGAASSILVSLFVSNFFDIEVFGKFSVFLTGVMFLSMFGKAGLDIYFFRYGIKEIESNKFDSLLKRVFINCLKVQLGMCILIYITLYYLRADSPAISFVFDNIYILFLCGLFNSIADIFSEEKRIFDQLGHYALFRYLIFPSAMLLYLVIFSYFDITETGLLAILCASITYLIIVICPVASRLVFISEDNSEYKGKILQLSMPMMFISGIMFLMGYADTYMIAYFLDVKDSSIYAAIMKLSASITFITSIVITIRAKGIVVCNNSYEKLKAHFRITSRMILLISLPIVCLVFLFGEGIIGLYGQKYFSEYSYLLNLYVVAVLINSLPMGYYFVLTDRQNELLKIILVGLILNVLLNYLYIPIYGLDAAVITTLISNAVWNILAFLYLKLKKVL